MNTNIVGSESTLQAENEALKQLVKEYSHKLESATALLDTYQAFITPDQFDKVESTLTAVNNILSDLNCSSLDEVKAKVEDLSAKVESYSQIGTVEECDKAADILQAYADLGTVEEFESVINSVKEYEEIGSIAECNKAVDILQAYADLGSVEECRANIEAMKKLEMTPESVDAELAARHEADLDKTISSIALKYNITKDSAATTFRLCGESQEATEEYLSSLNITAKSESFAGAKLVSSKNESATAAPKYTKTFLGQF